jgi:transposase
MTEPQITHERVDDIPVLLHVLRKRLALDQILDEQLSQHGNWQGLSFGGVTVTWLTHILTECDHQTLGWRCYVTNAPRRQMSLEQGIQCYADEYLVERNCRGLKGRPLSLSPLWVTREDHAVGLTRLLTLAARVLGLVEYEVRQQLKAQKETLVGLFPGQATREAATPTTERLLKAFDNSALIVIRKGDHIERHLTPLSALQKTILRLLKCPISWYQQLALDSG